MVDRKAWRGVGSSSIAVRLGRICVTAVIATASASHLHAQVAGAFESARAVPLASPAWETVAADLDGDGDQDLATLLSNVNRIAVLRNRGDGRFEPAQLDPSGGIFPQQLACTDFDGDGDLDLFVLDEDPLAARVFANHGDGTFASGVGYAAGYHPFRSSVADFDGDGRADVVLTTRVAYGSPEEMRALWNDGSGGLTTSTLMAGPSGVQAMRSADVDGDGDVDLALLAAGQIVVMRNRGDRTFEIASALDVGADIASLELDDHDADGDVDAFLVQQNYASHISSVRMARNLGGASFGTPVLIAAIPLFSKLAIDDWNGDHRLDFVVHDAVSDQLSTYFGHGDTTFGLPHIARLEASLETIMAVDLDGDGDPDLAASTANGLVTLKNRGGARFDTEERTSQGGDEVVEGADLDGDGDFDLVTHGQLITVHENLGEGIYGPASTLSASNHSVDACLVDIDGDGDLDIARVSDFDRGIAIWNSHGDGTFAGPTHMEFAGYPSTIASGDVDADGDMDLVIGIQNEWWFDTRYEALVLKNRGDGTLDRGDHFETDEIATLTELMDVDGDGDLDLALATWAVDPYFVRNDGSGRFDDLHAQQFPAGTARFLDLNLDGFVDVLAHSYPDILYRRNRGDGTFEPGHVILAGSSFAADRLVAGDIDGDGDLDLTEGFGMYENVGDESFELVDTLHASNFGRPWLGDVDGDGDDDLVLGDELRVIRNGSRIGVAAGLGDGSGVPCPCGNSGTTGRGCANSADARGACLRASGNARIANDTLVLASDGTTSAPALFFQGTQSLAGGLGSAFGDGLLCAGGSVTRLGVKHAAGGDAALPTGFERPIHALGGVVAPGSRVYQVLYRDAGNFCTPNAFNLTNAVVVTWIP